MIPVISPCGWSVPRFIRPILFALCFVIITIPGCKRGETLTPVQGKVTIAGVPLKGGPRCFVIYQPDRAKGNTAPHEPRSLIAEDGSYKLVTVDREGVPPGWYKVRVDAADVIDMKSPYVTKWLVPERYVDFDKSGLTMEVVVSAPTGAYDLKLTK